MFKQCMKNGFNIADVVDLIKWKINDYREHPYWFRTFGTCVFCGAQGEGKTLSAVQYVLNIAKEYPHCVIVSNVAIRDLPFNTILKYDKETQQYVLVYQPTGEVINTQWILEHAGDEDFQHICIEYTGLEMLKYVNNNEYGVVFLIDEIHLELNSLESKNIDIEVMVEISQQRKQRKHIVGTSQVYMRMAKPLREQIHDIILCSNLFGFIQYNRWVTGESCYEENGKLKADVNGRFIWSHSPDMYAQYDTYTKMKRYNQEWNGRKRIDNIYERGEVIDVEFKR